MTAAVTADDHGVVVGSRARSLMGVLRPVVWMVLQDMVLDAEWCGGSLVAQTSVRLVAEHLHLDPMTAASALRALRTRGLVELEQASGPNGRFGLAAYALRLPEGIAVWSPCVDTPNTDNSDTVTRPGDDGLVLRCPWNNSDASPRAGSPPTGEEASDVVDDRRADSLTGKAPLPGPSMRAGTPDPGCAVETSCTDRQPSSPAGSGEQGAFDLGSAQ